jgi:D-inositol-3-phosphate glycosyltransferase
MKIALISYWTCPLERVGVLSAGGMNIYVLNLSNYLGKMGHKIDIYTRVHKTNDEKIIKLHENVRIIHLRGREVSNTDYYSRNLLEFIRKNKLRYDIFHAHYFYSGVIGLLLRTHLKIPQLVTFHSLGKTKELYIGIKDKKRIPLEKKVIEAADGIVASTELEKNDLKEYYQTKGAKIFVVSPGVNHYLFKPQDKFSSRKKLLLPKNKKIILFVGRIDPIKGITLLIEAISALTKIYPTFQDNFRVLLIGGDIKSSIFWQNQEVKKIKQLIAQKELECCIKFIGSKPHRVLPYYYSASDVVVAPSLYESFGLVVLEAMATGACILASRAGGLKYLVKDRVNGRLFESGNTGDLAKILWELLNDQKQRKRLGKKAFSKSLRFCWDIQAKKMIDVYKHYL